MNPKLRSVQLRKSFLLRNSKVLILDNLDFELWEGEFVSIVGPSGCGKSTFLELLAGICKPDSGDILLDGLSILGKSGLLGYMPQDDLLLPWLKVWENALLPIRMKNLPIKDAKQKARSLGHSFGLEKHLDHYPWQLSGGLKQRAAFLRTCMTGSPLLLLDEPFANLDALTRITMQDWLKMITQKLGLTIILVTHDIEEALKLSDRILIMSSAPGKIIQILKLPSDLDLNTDLHEKYKQNILKSLIQY